ncbi:hypothetical protein [Terricaulis sp.]|uniref:hypothetical protein n=1 Tax=Terricaulis sp. TaxID=2768686 RepID=UPI0037847125
MILSTNRESNEYEKIREQAHIEKVWADIEAALPKYWSLFLERDSSNDGTAKLAAHFGSPPPKHSRPAPGAAFVAPIQQYEHTAAKYREFFDPCAMEEFADDPNSFKAHLRREVPVIAGTLNQRRPELQAWQRDFHAARGKDLLEVFSNVLDFRDEWATRQPESVYAQHDAPSDFALDPLDEDEGMTLTNVIGMGIKSIVLFHLDARIFPQRARSDLYGLYFLSGMKSYGLSSGSSEFLMINDREPAANGSFIMEHNFWYPYGLYSTYAMRLFRWMDAQVRAAGGGLDPHVRYVFVSHFLSSVCSQHVEHMRIMRAHDRFEVPA